MLNLSLQEEPEYDIWSDVWVLPACGLQLGLLAVLSPTLLALYEIPPVVFRTSPSLLPSRHKWHCLSFQYKQNSSPSKDVAHPRAKSNPPASPSLGPTHEAVATLAAQVFVVPDPALTLIFSPASTA